MTARRHADLTAYSQRLTPAEVARLWFRRAPDMDIHTLYPDFPKAGPDGLYLRESVKLWFDRWHGIGAGRNAAEEAEQEALRVARGGGRQSAPSAN